MTDPVSGTGASRASSVAIIGSGLAGAAAARQLGRSMPDGLAGITLYEIGRGPGGRASTRSTRSIPACRINHGAPYAAFSTRAGREFAASLGNAIRPYPGRQGVVDGPEGVPRARDEDDSSLRVTGESGEMAAIADALVSDARAAHRPPLTTAYSTMVRQLTRGQGDDDPWVLADKDGQTVGEAQWLIVAGSGVAHPRWSETFGGEPPLAAAAAGLQDTGLDAALSVIARQTAAPVLTTFFYCTGATAARWRDTAFHDLIINDHAVLAKLSVQPVGTDGCAVVLHSTTDYARQNAGVHGASSSAARVGGANANATQEARLIETMLGALSEIAGLPSIDASSLAFGPLLHRWGNAFPQGDPLPASLSVCPNARVAFCGDYVETAARMGSCESALLSGVNAAEAIKGIGV
jgi:predicted NAD/FAD-dependent oxidoreductase